MPTEHRVLVYATPPPAGGFVRAPAWVIILVAVVWPGLPSVILRGLRGIAAAGSLLLILVSAFWFFGPFWGGVLFRNSPLSEAGLYPFIGTCVAVCLTSVSLALRDRRHVLRDLQSRDARPGPPVRDSACGSSAG